VKESVETLISVQMVREKCKPAHFQQHKCILISTSFTGVNHRTWWSGQWQIFRPKKQTFF